TFLDRIRSIQSELTIQVQEIILGKLNIQKATIDAKVKKDALNILVKSGFEQGSQESQFSINFADLPGDYALQADIDLKSANASNVIKLLDKDSMVDGGTLNLSFKGNTKGNNFKTMISNLSGKAVVYIQNMKLLNKTIDSRHLDLFAAILKSFDNKKNETLFECVAIKLDFLNGIAKANQSIALETPDIYAMGAGVLNLRTSKLDFAFNLYPRSNVNIEIGSLDQRVYLKGTIENPQIVLSPKALIKEGGTLALGVATGGLSLLAEKLYKVTTKQSSPCKQVLTHG
ncbi:MAG: AsmA-like C-terminal region-containing protein, partial [Candidatus Berkiella sp.]